jgi:alcohol dehydrogenase (cytochrome c)
MNQTNRFALLVSLGSILLVTGVNGTAQSQKELNAAASTDDAWLTTNKDYAGHRFVNLRQIDKSNIAKLEPICTYESGLTAPSQSSPVVYKGIMYVTVGYLTAAIVASSCREIWRYVWTPTSKELSNPNRGAAIKDGKIVRVTPDGNLIALDSGTGKLLWSKQVASPKDNYYLSMPTLIYEDLVICGTAGADFGARGWLGAFRLENGDEVWKYYAVPKPGEPGSETWTDPKVMAHGGGSFWTPLSLDVKKGILFAPVGNPAPDFYGDVRNGTNLHTNSAVAIDVKSGQVLWQQQFVEHDIHDWDLSQVSPLITAQVKGKKRNIVIVSGKDGLYRAVDRDTHELLYEIPITTRKNVDAELTVQGVYVCPGLLGGEEWSSPAFSPRLNLTFTPSVDWCGLATITPEPPEYLQEEHYRGGMINLDPPEKARGWVTAIDVSTGEARWKYAADSPMLANITATASDLIFTGTSQGDFIALDARTGEVLYRHSMGKSVAGGLLSYAINGKQYVAVESGKVSAFFGGQGSASFTIFALP